MKCLIVGFAAVMVLVSVEQVSGSISNGGFETGTLTGWSTSIPFGAWILPKTSWSGFSPTEGSYFAVLKTDGPGNTNRLYQSFSAVAGDILSFDVYFDAEDYMPYNDSARAYIWDTVGNAKVSGGDLFFSNVSAVGNFGQTPWTSVSHTFTSAGSYELRIEIQNYTDSAWDSYAGVDNVVFTPIPEPSGLIIWSLFGVLGTGVGWWRRRKAA